MADSQLPHLLTPEVLEAQRLLRQGSPDSAEQALRGRLRETPDDIEARYALAVAQRQQHRWVVALKTLGALAADKPGFGRAYQEAGYNHVALRDFEQARIAFEQATTFDPGLINSW